MSLVMPVAGRAACACGESAFAVDTPKLARFICHCTICQAFTGKPFSDMTVMRAKHVTAARPDSVAFRKYRLPPNINRGTCRSCGKPAIEYGGFGPATLAFIPSASFEHPERLPPPAMHIFYHRRQADAADSLPRYEGYLRSEIAVCGLVARVF